MATVLIDRYVQREHKWPSSWDDLCTVPLDNTWAGYEWPDDVERVRLYINIEFGVELQVVASQTADKFDAIRPTGACYPYRHYGYVDALIQTAKDHVDAQHGTHHS
ncbi:MAG: hypothetical protein JW829_03300 [Pirellulales bacterium]|nr:hypothetical protein [Pirellulales bacterium]